MAQAARKLVVQQPVQQPMKKPNLRPIKQTKKVPFSLLEKVLLVGAIAGFIFLTVQIVGNTADLYQINHGTVEIQSKIERQGKLNSDLQVQVSELSTYERILERATKLGLTLNENNVKVVSR